MVRHKQPPKQANDSDSLVVTHLSDVTARKIAWLWEHRIPIGMVTMVAGDGGLGKSTILLDLAARVTTGRPMPNEAGGPFAPRGVLVFSAEDDLPSVVVPRLVLAGANRRFMSSVKIRVAADRQRELVIDASDLERLRSLIVRESVVLVIFDPFVAYVPGSANLHHNQDARRVLADLHHLAEHTGCAVVVIHHLNKGQHQEAVHRLTGSTGLSTASRSLLVVGPHPDDATGDRKVLAVAKNNLAPRSTPSLGFRLVVPPGEDHPTVEWGEPCTVSANDLVARLADPEARSALAEARAFLRKRLIVGPVLADDAFAEAKARGISKRTLERARPLEGVTPEKEKGGRGRWYWRLGDLGDVDPSPGSDSTSTRPPRSPNAEVVEENSVDRSAIASVADLTKPQPPASKAHTAASCTDCGGRTVRGPIGDVCSKCSRRVASSARARSAVVALMGELGGAS